MNEKCAFRRKTGEGGREFCAYTSEARCCWLCGDFQVGIDALNMRDLYILNEGRRARRITLCAVFLSFLMALASLASLCVSVVSLLVAIR